MKKLFILSLLLVNMKMFSQTTTPKLFMNINSHNEMTLTGWNAEPYDTAPTYTYYFKTRDTLRKIVDMIYLKGAKYDLQTCQRFVMGCLHAESAATTNTDIIQYAYELGGVPGGYIDIDPRSKKDAFGTYTYNIADVAHLIDSTGAKASKTLGGFVYYNTTVPAANAWSDVNCDWSTYTATINPVSFNTSWKANIIWGAGSILPHTHDANNYGTWKPRGKSDSIDFYCHDPNQNLWLQGNGCAWNLDSAANTNIQTIISEIRSEATKIVNGTYPSNKFYNASLMFNFKDFKKFNMRASLATIIDSINVMVGQKKIVWATIKQKQDSFNVWSAATTIKYSQWKCGQTNTIAATCNLSSVTEFDKDDGFLKVYPNPANSELSYEFQSLTGKETYFYVYDNLGREVIKKQITESLGKISLNNLPSGLYLINATSIRPKKLLIVK